MIYEERRVTLARGGLAEYQRLWLEEIWPALTALGARPLCLLSGLIGMPVEETYAFTGFADAGGWQRLQRDTDEAPRGVDEAVWSRLRAIDARRAGLVAEESVHLLRPSALRPKLDTPPEDRRAVYGMRRFRLRATDWQDFVRFSSEGVWVRIEAQDARILALFRDAAATDPLEATLLTGYHGPAHWEETRFWRERPADVPEDVWETGRQHQHARNAITLRSHVCLMTAHWPSR